MDALNPTSDGQIKTKEGWHSSCMELLGNQVWVLELEPDNSPLNSRDLEETQKLPRTETAEIQGSSVRSRQSPEQRESEEVKSCTPAHLQAKETFTGNRETFSPSLMLTKKLLPCDQCGKAFRYPSDLTRHQHVHSRQKAAKRTKFPSEADGPTSLKPTPVALQAENTFTKSGKALSQKSKVTTDQSRHRKRQHLCDQCGKAFCYPSDLARHQDVHSRQKAAKQGQSQSEVESPSLLVPRLLALEMENTFTQSSKALPRNSKAMAGWNTRPRKLIFCSQCGKGCRKPSELARHERVHLRQKAAKWVRARQKGIQSQSEAGNPTFLDPTPVEPQVESRFPNSSQALCQNSKVTTDQSTCCGRLPFCSQRGKASQSPCELPQHQRSHSRPEAAKQRQFGSEAQSPTPSALQSESVNSPKILHKDSEVRTMPWIHPKESHTCKHCGKCFLNPSDLARHQDTHSRVTVAERFEWVAEDDAPNFSVSVAVPLLPTRTLKDCHEASSHNSTLTDQSPHMKKTYLCNWCGKHFPSPSSLAQHEGTHLQRQKANQRESSSDKHSPTVPLPKVPWTENEVANLNETISPSSTRKTGRSSHTKKPYLCDQCGEGFWWHSELAQHVYTHSREPYHCGICGCQFKRRVQLVKHQKCHEESQEWEEDDEGFQNIHSDNDLGGQDLPPEKTGEPYKLLASPETCECGACDSGVNDDSELLPKNTIWEIGMSGQPYPMCLLPGCECGYCESSGEDGGSEQPTELSLLQAEVALRATPVSPVSSGETVTTVPTLPAACPRDQGHVVSVPEEKTSTASITADQAALSPQNGILDPEWLPSLSHSSQLRKQARSSMEGAKPHSCPTCSKRFRCAGYLRKHLNIHRPGKPYSCPLCERRFGRRSYLLKHHRNIHGESGPLLSLT